MSPILTATLRRIESLTAKLEDLSRQREMAIAKAVAAGATWREIAGSLGCSPQAAHRRYRWLRHNEKTGEVWHEGPLPL
jgi:FixJ family two-component response regulator